MSGAFHSLLKAYKETGNTGLTFVACVIPSSSTNIKQQLEEFKADVHIEIAYLIPQIVQTIAGRK